MKVETRFNLRNKIWFLYNNRPVEATVRRIDIHHDKHCTYIKYETNLETDEIRNSRDNPQYVAIHEQNAFATKEELLKSL